MLYFIPWAIFLLLVLLAVPIASMVEKRKYHASMPTPDPAVDDPASGDVDADAMDASPDDEFGSPVEEEVAEVQFDAPGGDDFSAFDEDFK